VESPNLLGVDTLDVIQFAIFAGVMGSALLSAAWLIRERARIAAENFRLRAQVADLSAAAQRSDGLLYLKDQRIIVWGNDRKKPELIGTLASESGVPEERSAFLAFGRWLTPRSASAVEQAIAGLRERAAAFDLVAETQLGGLIEVQGRHSASLAIVRFNLLSEARRAHARLKADHQELLSEYETIRALLDVIDIPFWLRGPAGELRRVNRAYAKAMNSRDPESAVTERQEFLGTETRERITRHREERGEFAGTVSTVIGGERRIFAVVDVAAPGGSAGLAIDHTEIENMRAEYERTIRNHTETLDQVATAVAIFDQDQKLRFYNQAFQKLWDLQTGFLASAPENALLLDRLRSEGKLAEQPEWRRWKEGILKAYRAPAAEEHLWHLPDGRTLRVIGNPNPKGGVTWVFENLTEKLDLESRYNIAIKVQRETLDNLAEGVAVFGPDGRLRL
jgi:PAS domain-containing protein